MAANYDFYNNYGSTLGAILTIAATSATVVSAGSLATPAAGKTLLLTLISASDDTVFEIIKVTAVSDTTLTIVRAQESSTAREWPAGTLIQARLTGGIVADLLAAGFKLDHTNSALGTSALDLQTYRASAGRAATGARSTAAGYDNSATGADSTSVGSGNTASAANTVAIGKGNTASAVEAVAIGEGSTASATGAVAIGDGATASGSTSVAIGDLSVANSASSTAVGSASEAKGDFSAALAGGKAYDPQDYTVWAAAAAVTAGTIRKLSGNDDYLLVCVVAGTTAGTQPTVSAAGVVTDNTAKWMATYTTSTGERSFAANGSQSAGMASFAQGSSSLALGYCAFAAGDGAYAVGRGAVAVGYATKAYGEYSTIVGRGTTVQDGRDVKAVSGFNARNWQLPFSHSARYHGFDFIGEHQWLFDGAADETETAYQTTRKVTLYSIPIQIGDGARPGTSTAVKHGYSFIAGGYIYTAYCYIGSYYGTGTTAGSAPALTTTPGDDTTDGTVSWICVGATAGFNLQALMPDYARFTPTKVGVMAKWSTPGGGATYPQLTFGPNGALTQWLGATTHSKLTGDYSNHMTDPTDTRGAKQFGAAVSTFGTDLDCVAVIVWEGYIRESDVA